MEHIYQKYLSEIERSLKACFAERTSYGKLFEAMRYSLLAGGKRIRPVLTLAFCHVSGGAAEAALPAASAVEMIHTYSLIHDDLPCMDDDILRRGVPTSHVVFGEATAVLAGDALQAAAFEMVLRPGTPGALQAGQILAEAAGPGGICGGQILDMAGEGKDLAGEEVEEIHSRKTAVLIRAAAQMGCAMADGTKAQFAAAGRYADNLGLAFQMKDDLLNCEGTEADLGKPIGSDAVREKTTFVTLFGADRCKALLAEKTEAAKDALDGNFDDTGFLRWLADYLAYRRN